MPSLCHCFCPERKKQSDSKKISWSEWKQPVVAVALAFLCNIESSMLASGKWPYMSTIDHEATANFFGNANAANKAAHVLFTFIFSAWAYKTRSMKIPMILGRCITLVGCIMYIFVEFIPVNRRWWMLVCYVLFGIGFGTSPLLRAYIVRTTSEENRSSGYALLNGASVMSVMVGPIVQIAFAGLPYPGVDIIPPHIKLNVYSAPIWFAVITNIIAILIAIFLVNEPEVVEKPEDTTPLASIKGPLERIRALHLPWVLIALVVFEMIVSGIFNATMAVIVGPLLTSMYALEGTQIVVLLGVSQIIVGFLAVAFSVSFLLFKLGNRVSCRVLFAFSNIMMIAGYMITYPYPFMSSPMQPFNETTRTGCDPLQYSWCDTQMVVNIIPFFIILIIVSSFAIPSSMLSLDTIYSKLVGDVDQNLMQAFVGVADGFLSIVGPIYGTSIFTAIGLSYLQIINGCIYILGTVLWFAAWRWLQPYN